MLVMWLMVDDGVYCGCGVCVCVFYILFCTQKTAYEMRISDWSSDVCSSDLTGAFPIRCRASKARGTGRVILLRAPGSPAPARKRHSKVRPDAAHPRPTPGPPLCHSAQCPAPVPSYGPDRRRETRHPGS